MTMDEKARSEAPQPETDETALCPSCSRFVGPKTRCPFCGASMRVRMSLKVFRWGSVAVAVLGLFFLYLWARNREIPIVRVAEVVESMNMAYVRVEGTAGRVTSSRDAAGRMEYLSFDLDDGTGVARVQAFRHLAQVLDDRGLVPRRGDRVELAGSVRTGEEGQVRLLLQTADHVRVAAREAPHVPLAELGTHLAGQRIVVEGRVSALFEPDPGSRSPFRILLADGEERATVVIWPRSWDAVRARGLARGVYARLRAEVGEYRGRVQLTLDEATDAEFGPAPQAKPAAPAPAPDGILAPGDVDRALVGRSVRVGGRVARIARAEEGSRRPHTLELVGGGASRDLVAWGDVLDAALEAGLKEGDEVTAQVTVSEYRDRIQLKLEKAEDLVVAAGGAAGPTLAPGAVTKEQIGTIVTVEGTVSVVSRTRSGVKVTLEDGASTLQIFLKKGTSDDAAGLEALGHGARVRARGPVVEFRGVLQVAPEAGADFRVLEGGIRAPEERTTGSLGASDAGAVVILEGVVKAVEAIPKGTKLVLDDGSGKAAAVVVWDGVKKKLQDPGILAVGRRLQVVGQVTLFRGDPQVVPQDGWDVTARD